MNDDATKPAKVRLSPAQMTGLGCLDDEGSYSANRRYTTGSPNFYHDRHRPGNLYVDARTARVLIERGFAELRYGRLFRTEAGRDFWRANRPKHSDN